MLISSRMTTINNWSFIFHNLGWIKLKLLITIFSVELNLYFLLKDMISNSIKGHYFDMLFIKAIYEWFPTFVARKSWFECELSVCILATYCPKEFESTLLELLTSQFHKLIHIIHQVLLMPKSIEVLYEKRNTLGDHLIAHIQITILFFLPCIQCWTFW